MGNGCFPCYCKDKQYHNEPSSVMMTINGEQIDLEKLSNVISLRSVEITNSILNGPLNNTKLPDFIERRLLEAIISLTLTIVVRILIPEKYTNEKTRL